FSRATPHTSRRSTFILHTDGRGLGTRLVLHVCDWAADNGIGSVTLTTFRDVAWNMPVYARLGFEVVPHAQLSPARRAVVEDETRRGLDPARRVVMRRRLLHIDSRLDHRQAVMYHSVQNRACSNARLLPSRRYAATTRVRLTHCRRSRYAPALEQGVR